MLIRHFLRLSAIAAAVLAFAYAPAGAKPHADGGVGVTVTKSVDLSKAEKNIKVAQRRGRRFRRGWRGRRGWRRGWRRGPAFYFGAPLVYPYYYRPYYYRPLPPVRRSGCGYWHRQCVRNWGAYNADYYGCMRFHGC